MSKSQTQEKKPFTVTLTVVERVLLNGLLNGQGSYEDLIIHKSILDITNLSPEEIEAIEFKSELDQAFWNVEKAKKADKTIEYTDIQVFKIAQALRKASDEKRLTLQHISLYEKFVERK